MPEVFDRALQEMRLQLRQLEPKRVLKAANEASKEPSGSGKLQKNLLLMK